MMADHALRAQHLSCGYRGHAVLEDIDLSVSEGEIVCLLGPNGVGKTTLFRTLLGSLTPIAGIVQLDGRERAAYSRRSFARLVGYVPQTHDPPFPYTVQQIVEMGCAARLDIFDTPSVREARRALDALADLGIEDLASRPYTQVSGGERQMALIARALMQDAPLLMMDEPTAALDFGNQVSVLRTISRLAARGHGVLMTTHNPDHAFLCATRVVLILRDKTVLSGAVDDVLTAKNLKRAYGVDVRIVEQQDEKGNMIRTCTPTLDERCLDIDCPRPASA